MSTKLHKSPQVSTTLSERWLPPCDKTVMAAGLTGLSGRRRPAGWVSEGGVEWSGVERNV